MAQKKVSDSDQVPVTTESTPDPGIDQESMTEAVADRQRETVDTEDSANETNVVRYLGVVTERRISREDWEKAGVTNQDGVAWTKATGYVVPIDQFSEDALRVLSAAGNEFRIVRDR